MGKCPSSRLFEPSLFWLIYSKKVKKRQRLQTDDTPEIGICMCLRRLEQRMCLWTLTAWRKYNSVFDNNEILPNLPMDVLVREAFSVRVCVRATHHCCDNPIGMCLNVIFTCALINYHITFNYLLSRQSDNKTEQTIHVSAIRWSSKWVERAGEREREQKRCQSKHIFSLNINPTNAITSQKTLLPVTAHSVLFTFSLSHFQGKTNSIHWFNMLHTHSEKRKVEVRRKMVVVAVHTHKVR